MTGQHRKTQRSAGRRAFPLALVIVLVGVLGVGSWYGNRHNWFRHQSASCATTSALAISAAPEIAPALSTEANAWNAKKTTVDSACVRITVTPMQPSDVASAIAGSHQATVAGLGKPDGTAKLPDVWVPDSSTWIERLTSASSQITLKGTPVASSPVVVAIPQPVAKALGSSLTSLTWAQLLTKMTSGAIRSGIVDPNVDASGLSALLAVGNAATGAGTSGGATTVSTQGQAALVGAMRALATGDSLLRDDLMGQFPRATDASTIGRSLSAAPIPEQALLAYNAAQPPVPLVGLYLNPTPPALDYPYTPMQDLSKVKADAAAQFAKRLTGSAWKNTLAGADLRAADGTFGPDLPQTAGMPKGPLTRAAVPAAAIGQALSTWSAVTVPGRMLAVIDVSGSMATKVPTAGGATREAVTVAAARAGLGLFDDRWSLGLWTFATDLNGTLPYKQLVPIGPLSTGRPAVQSALPGIQPIPQGNTGLYDTVLAAYKTVQQGWDPSRVNSIVIMTDGQNDNPGGITLPTLLAQIKKIADPAKPIEVIAIGIGDGVDKTELAKITTATGGGVFLATDPSKIGSIFLQAIALRPGAAK